MNQTFTKNQFTYKTLNKLVTEEFYKGSIHPDGFVLVRRRFPFSANNHRLIGFTNNEGRIELKFDFNPPLNVAFRIAGVAVIISSIVLLIYGNWMIPIVFILFGSFILLDFKSKREKGN